jgi:hypothetical protein
MYFGYIYNSIVAIENISQQSLYPVEMIESPE